MQKKKAIKISVIVVLVLAVILFFVFRKSSKSNYQLETTSISKRNINTIVTATGTLEPITKVDVGTQVSGIIDKIYVDYNSVVKTGQILAELDKVTLQSDLQSKEMDLKTAQIEYDFQKKNFDRIKNLYDQGLVSRTDYESSEYDFNRSETAYRKATSDLTKAKTNLSYATVYSPINGVVLSRAVEEGQTVAASFNTPTLFTIANDLTKMQVVADVDEADIGGVKVGQRVSFMVDTYPTDIFKGTVVQVRLEATVTSSVVTYQVVINAPNPDLKLKPGLTANVTIYTIEKDSVNSISNKALSFMPDEDVFGKMGYNVGETPAHIKDLSPSSRRVWLKQGENIVPKIIQTGATDGVNTEVTSGLTADDAVVTGVAIASLKNDKAANGETSPFMPQRGNRNRR